MFFQSLLTSIHCVFFSLHCYSFTMSSTNDVRVASGESAEAKRERGSRGFKEGVKDSSCF